MELVVVRMSRRDLLDVERTTREIAKIGMLALELLSSWPEAADSGARAPRSDGGNARGRGFVDHDPVSSAVISPMQAQIRGKARRSAILIAQALERLEEAATMIDQGMLLMDDRELARFLEKRAAALGR